MFRCFFGQKEKVNPKPSILEPTRNKPVVPSPQEDLERRIIAEFRPVLNIQKEITKNNAVLSRGAKEAERKNQEFIEAESQRVRDRVLDYIRYPNKYTEGEIQIGYAGGFDVDFEPLNALVNKCPGVGMKRGSKLLEHAQQLHNDRIDRKQGKCYYLVIRHIWTSEVFYVIW